MIVLVLHRVVCGAWEGEGVPRTTSKRDDIIAAATELIRSKGVHAASIKAIIDASGASAGTIYHHFKNKNDIVLAVAQHAIAEPITTILTRPRSGPLSPGLLFREVSEAVLGGHIDSALIVQLWAGSSTDPELNAMLHGLMVAVRNVPVEFIAAWLLENGATEAEASARALPLAQVAVGQAMGLLAQRTLDPSLEREAYLHEAARMLDQMR